VRLASVLDRIERGRSEGDLIIGKKMTGAIGTLVERTSRYLILIHLPFGYKAPQLRDALIEQYGLIPPALRKTLTWDQGREMAAHEQAEAALGTKIYFYEPRSPWQRSTNENMNGLIRQYFPKHTDLRVHTAVDFTRVAQQLNQRQHLVLGDQTREQVMRGLALTGNTS
jgi:IS30 family transposase